ncbi:hypothetical protein FO519_007028 [Halicephalobus sp. NKZ332]|nr:hypothetical protein FO519_007028 [Halicephalobus sp. NKZ332]
MFFLSLLLFYLIRTSSGRFCAHTTKGLCEVPDMFGWCFHDKSTGLFNCDEGSFCKNRTAIQGKTQIAGCFDINGKYLCCCNKGVSHKS